MAQPDFIIAGGGIIGLSLALELDRRGASVTVLEAGHAMRQTSAAAAGMLAVDDSENPAALSPLSRLSASLYPAFIDRIEALSGHRVALQTHTTLEECRPDSPEAIPNGHDLLRWLAPEAPPFHALAEDSVDPRQLGEALLAAVQQTKIELREQTALQRIAMSPHSVRVETNASTIEAPTLIDCMGSWSPAPVVPRKGQMLAVLAPPGFDLTAVVRTHKVYVVPRTHGQDAGRLIIGATMEEVGFDLTVHPKDILLLNARAVRLMPALAEASFVESWAGLRPGTADGLPILGAAAGQPRYVLATGHFRNGILLAPATAHVIAQTLLGEPPSLDLTPFSPARFQRS